MFGNIAIAAMHAQAEHDLDRIAVVDFDVHHSNGTQKAFWTDPDVLSISLHQDNFYPPGESTIDEVGADEGPRMQPQHSPAAGLGRRRLRDRLRTPRSPPRWKRTIQS